MVPELLIRADIFARVGASIRTSVQGDEMGNFPAWPQFLVTMGLVVIALVWAFFTIRHDRWFYTPGPVTASRVRGMLKHIYLTRQDLDRLLIVFFGKDVVWIRPDGVIQLRSQPFRDISPLLFSFADDGTAYSVTIRTDPGLIGLLWGRLSQADVPDWLVRYSWDMEDDQGVIGVCLDRFAYEEDGPEFFRRFLKEIDRFVQDQAGQVEALERNAFALQEVLGEVTAHMASFDRPEIAALVPELTGAQPSLLSSLVYDGYCFSVTAESLSRPVQFEYPDRIAGIGEYWVAALVVSCGQSVVVGATTYYYYRGLVACKGGMVLDEPAVRALLQQARENAQPFNSLIAALG